MPTLTAPGLVSSREQARQLIEELPLDLSDCAVHLDCSGLEIGTSSFVDELVKACLVERHARLLSFDSAPIRIAQLALRAAKNHGVADRLEVHRVEQGA